MNRGRRSEKIFLSRKDYEIFCKLLQEASALWTAHVAAFSFMPNHYHLLLNTPKGNLSRFMRHVNSIYTQLFNRNNRCEGQLFRGRFKSILVDGDSYLVQLLRYIHRNPIRSKLVKHMEDFEWSSHRGYVSKAKKWDWLYKDFMLSILSRNRGNQLLAYQEFMYQKDDAVVIRILEGKKWPVLWGSDAFIQLMKEKYFKKKRNREVPESGYLSPGIEHIISMVCQYYPISLDDLCQRKRRPYNEPRDVAVYLSRRLRNDTLDQLCKDFLLNSHSSVSSILRKIKQRIGEDKGFRRKVAEIEESCLKSQVQT